MRFVQARLDSEFDELKKPATEIMLKVAGESCRSRDFRVLRKFPTLAEAEFGI